MEPAKTSMLVKKGYQGLKPLLQIKKPYEKPKNKKAAQMGRVRGKAARKAFLYLSTRNISFT